MARRRQHRQTESQAGNDFEIPGLEQINSHCCPPKRRYFRQAVRRLGINHDRIERSADTSSLSDNYAPVFSIGGCIPVFQFQWRDHFRRWRGALSGRCARSTLRASVRSMPQLKSGDLPLSAVDPRCTYGFPLLEQPDPLSFSGAGDRQTLMHAMGGTGRLGRLNYG
jgi:hypothetical protein